MNGYTDHYGNHTDSTDGLTVSSKPSPPRKSPPQANPLALQVIKRPLLTLC